MTKNIYLKGKNNSILKIPLFYNIYYAITYFYILIINKYFYNIMNE